jgi:catechol 2,3-dioxygenase
MHERLISQLAQRRAADPNAADVVMDYQPDWEPVHWVPAQGSNTMFRNLSMPDSMTESFPPAEAGAVPEPELAGLANPWASGEGR